MSLTPSFTQASQSATAAAGNAQSILKGGNYLNSLTDKGPAILRPKTVIGIGGFVFDYAGEISVTRQVEITDHYMEDNSVANDHIGIRPVRLVLKGLSSEVVQTQPAGLLGIVDLLQNKLGQVPALLGKYTPQATQKLTAALTQAQKTINQIDTGLSRVKNIVGLFGKANPGNTKQSQDYLFLEALIDSRQVFLVETPYKIFDNMVIENLGVTQPDETKYQSDVVVTLKQLRFVEVKVSSVANPNLAGDAAKQRTPPVDNGRTKGGSAFYDTFVKPFKGGS